MSDPREALMRLLSQHPPEVANGWFGCAGCHMSFGDAAAYAEHLAADVIEPEFLVVPRSDIVGIDYYVEASSIRPPGVWTDRATAVSQAADRGVEVRERPRLAWTPIRPEASGGS